MPSFDRKMRNILIEACEFDWSKVSPAIFGSLFQSVMDAEKRRNLGAHYTSEKNILKVISGLFLDELKAEFETVKNNQTKLKQFHEKLARLRFFDPACGCGNFLVITYREIRQLEFEILKQFRILSGNIQLQLDITGISKVDVDSFYGIEYEEFPSEIARVALWLTDHQANMNLSAEFGLPFVRLPLRNTPNILYSNALRIDWSELVSTDGNETETTLYILGNPPFVGGKMMDADQRADMEQVCKDVPNFGLLDYVCAWYVKAVKFAENSRIKIAFVSTNSITQGEQVGVLWQYLLDKGAKIHFAHRTFKWTNEASGKAAVYCVIVGFALFDINRKRLFDYETPIAESHEIEVKNINPYLIDSADVVISRRQKPLSDIPEMNFGNMPLDGGNLIISSFEEKQKLLNKNTNLEKYIKGFTGADEFINGKERWCLWFDKIQPTELRTMPDEIKKRIEAVKLFRENSKAPSTRKFAETPYLFRDRNLPNKYLLIPSVSSERRKYVPIGFLTSEVVTSNLCLIVPNATLYHFGVLTSLMHNAWMRQVCGRLKSDYRYSKEIVYNNFPFPKEPTDRQCQRVESTAQGILDVRLKFSGATLADLYDPLTMPKELLDAHRANDEAVDACYGKQRFKNELERLEFLFDLYRKYTEPLAVIEEKEMRKAKRKPRK